MNDKLKNNDQQTPVWDNSRYTKEIPEEELKKYSDKEYDQHALKMDAILLHAVSEQRCRPFGCRLQNCLGKFFDLNKCMTLYRQMNNCIEVERKKVIYEYIITNKQPMS
jgi:hypothetical protein